MSAADGNAVSPNTAMSGTTTDGATSGSVTTTQNGDLIFGAVADGTQPFATITSGTGFSARTTGAASGLYVEDKIQSTAGSVAATHTFGTNHPYVESVLALKSAASALTDTYANALFTLSQIGQATYRNSTDSTTAFQIQNAAGNNYLNLNTSGAVLSVGDVAIASTLQLGNSSGNVTQTINLGNNTTGTTNINIGNSAAGTVAVIGSTTITNRTSGSADTLIINNSSSTGSIAKFQDNGLNVFTLSDGGAALFKPSTGNDSATRLPGSECGWG
ncbi:MAG: hypothetical protein WDN27_03870 [Candidatus Saccharibacteria bacterium]